MATKTVKDGRQRLLPLFRSNCYGAPGYTALLRKVNWRKDCSSAWHQYYEFDQIDEAMMRIDDVIEPGELS